MGSSFRKSRGRRHPVPRPQQYLEGRGGESRPSSVPGPLAGFTGTAVEYRKGPIPDADELARYRIAHPDAPEIILDEFRAQAAHRRTLELSSVSLDLKALDAAILSERMGVVCGLVIALVGFGCGTHLVATGHSVAGTVIFGLDVGALVSAFILGRPRLAERQG